MRSWFPLILALFCFAFPMLACGQSIENVNVSEPVDLAYDWIDGSAFKTLIADAIIIGATGLAELSTLDEALEDLSDVVSAPNAAIENLRSWRDSVLSRDGLSEPAFRVIRVFNNVILAIETGSKPRDKLSSGNAFHLATMIERVRSKLAPAIGT